MTRQIKLATLFSGIGAIEQAFMKMGLNHKIMFVCDNGERTLPLLTNAEEKYLSDIQDKKKEKEEQKQLETEHIDSIRDHVFSLSSKKAKKDYVDHLYERCNKPNMVSCSYFANYDFNHDDYYQDIRFFDGRDYSGKVDIIVGGSPCQSFSSNGKRGGFEDTRGTLFYDYARTINEIQPKAFIFENVRGMLNHDNGRTWNTIKNVFQELNYHIYIHKDAKGNEDPVLNAKDYGIPQNRMRIYIIGIRNDISLKEDFSFPNPIMLTTKIEDYLDPEVDAKYYLGQKGFEFVTTHPNRAKVGGDIMLCQKANQQFNWNGHFIFEPLSKKHSAEIMKNAFIGSWEGEEGVIRKFTPRECLRLMGFPDSFKIVVNDTTMYRQAGNSIVVNVLEALTEQLIKTGIFD